MGRVSNTLLPIALIFLLQFQATACSPNTKQTTPKFPPGFVDVMVPINNINGYIYIQHEDSTIMMPSKLFNYSESHMETLGHSILVPNNIEYNSVALSIGPNLDSFAAKLEFTDLSSGEIAEKLLSAKRDITIWRVGNFLSVVRGPDNWIKAIRNTLISESVLPIAEAYPKAWDLLHVLPENPKEQPIAAGFIHMSDVFMSSLGTKWGLDLRNFHQAFSTINATDMAFIFYAHDQISIPLRFGPDYLKEYGINAVFVTRSTYPGFVLEFFLNKFGSSIGLQKIPLVNGEKVLYSNFDGMHLIVKAIGNTVFIAIAHTEHSAKALIANALQPHI